MLDGEVGRPLSRAENPGTIEPALPRTTPPSLLTCRLSSSPTKLPECHRKMQSCCLQRRLKTHYSLLVPFPPLPFAYPPREPPSGAASRAWTASPPPGLPTPSLAAPNEIGLRELNQPDLLGPTSPSASRTTSSRWDAIEEIPPSPDSGATTKPPTSGAESSSVTPEDAFLVDFSKTQDPLNPQVRHGSPSSSASALVQT